MICTPIEQHFSLLAVDINLCVAKNVKYPQFSVSMLNVLYVSLWKTNLQPLLPILN